MAEKTENHWVVLIQKAPRGPLKTEEVLALLEQGVLTYTDLAYLIPCKDGSDDVKQASGWKLLWQFTEFDRRGRLPKKKDWAAIEEARKAATEQSVREILVEKLPEGMLEIDPEQLVLHASKSPMNFDLSENAPTEKNQVQFKEGHKKAMTIGAGALGLGLLVWAMPADFGNGTVEKTAHPSRVETKRAPASRPVVVTKAQKTQAAPQQRERSYSPPPPPAPIEAPPPVREEEAPRGLVDRPPPKKAKKKKPQNNPDDGYDDYEEDGYIESDEPPANEGEEVYDEQPEGDPPTEEYYDY